MSAGEREAQLLITLLGRHMFDPHCRTCDLLKMPLRNTENFWLIPCNCLKVVKYKNSTASKTREKRGNYKPGIWQYDRCAVAFYPQLSFIKPVCMKTNKRIVWFFCLFCLFVHFGSHSPFLIPCYFSSRCSPLCV